MVIVYNPPTGAKISEGFKGAGVSLAKAFEPNTTQYCEEEFANALVSTYPFLQIVSSKDAESLKEVKDEPKEEVKEEEPVVVDIPVAQVVKAKKKEEEEKGTKIPDDLKGTDWYGEGVKETKDE